jgi:hypothetical protein
VESSARPLPAAYDVGVRRARRIAALSVAAMLLAAPAAFADGDPASDVLLSQPYYLPYQPLVSKATTAKVKKVVAATEKAKLPMKIAVIATPTDLGAVPDLFGRPQQYAGFLYSEVQPAFTGQQFGLVVVMPAGIGLAGTIDQPKLSSAVRDVAISSGEDSDGLALAGAVAMEKIAKAAGKPIPEIVPISGGGSGSGFGTHAVIVTLELLGLLLGVLLALQARTRRTVRPAAAPAPPTTPAV